MVVSLVCVDSLKFAIKVLLGTRDEERWWLKLGVVDMNACRSGGVPGERCVVTGVVGIMLKEVMEESR